jgi:hypothetical protein
MATPVGLPQSNKYNNLGLSNPIKADVDIQGNFPSLSNLIGQNKSPLDRVITLTRFNSKVASRKREVTTTVRDLESKIRSIVKPDKDSCPWLKLASFGDDRTDKNSLRHDANVLSIAGIECDYDAGAMSIGNAAKRLKKAGVAALLYESASNTLLEPRFRILCPTSESLSPEKRKQLVARVNGLLDGTLDGASFNLSQAFLFGNIKGKEPIATRLVEGRYIDQAHNLDATAIGRRSKADTDGENIEANDESGSGAAFRKAMELHLANETVEAFADWAVDNQWKDYEANPDRAIERTWARAGIEAGQIALAERASGAVDFEDLGPDPDKSKDKSKFDVTATPFKIRGLKSIPPREWLYGKSYGRRLLSAIAATGGTGKSMLVVGEAVAIATGKPILGESLPKGALRVWHINSEDDKEELDRRFEAAIQHHGISEADLGNRLFYTGNETRFIVAKEDRNGLTIANPVVAAIKSEIKRLKIDVLTVDPFVSTHTVSENSNDKINAVAALWRSIAQDCDCSITLVHHMRKPASAKPGQAQTSYTVDDARGAVAFKDATRSFRVINKMTESAASKFGLDDSWRYLHVTNGKANYAPPSTAGKWFKLVSVDAADGEDGVGAIEAWELPTAAMTSHADVNAGLDALQDGMGRVDTRSPDWAGRKVAAAIGCDVAETAKLKTLIGQWVAAGYLATENRPDPNRKQRDYYVVKARPDSDFDVLVDTDEGEGESDV